MSKQTPEQHYEIWESFMLKVFEHLKTPPSNYEEFYKTVSKDYFLMTVEDHASLLAEVERLSEEQHEKESLNSELVEALNIIPADKLRVLAEWFDIYDRTLGFTGTEIQDNLRKMANLSESALSRAEN